MLINSTRKINKLKTHKAVRENIRLNKDNCIKSDLPMNINNAKDWIYQLAEINLINNLQTQNLNKNGKFIVKWWEN